MIKVTFRAKDTEELVREMRLFLDPFSPANAPLVVRQECEHTFYRVQEGVPGVSGVYWQCVKCGKRQQERPK